MDIGLIIIGIACIVMLGITIVMAASIWSETDYISEWSKKIF